jgi:2-polyprenyl-3-methyl-5-hydroxy-6-metoxy-1,4-benzoquinol methylase
MHGAVERSLRIQAVVRREPPRSSRWDAAPSCPCHQAEESRIPESSGLYYRGRKGRNCETRWNDVRQVADLRSTDHVLDVGCAEGLITLEVAGLVERVQGIDVHEGRIAEATRLAAERGIANATFDLASVVDYPLEPRSYDVSLFMGVWGKSTTQSDAGGSVGAEALRHILRATRRQLVMKVTVQHRVNCEPLLEEILDVCDQADFDALCFSRSMSKRGQIGRSAGANVLVAHRRGSDARIGELPRVALVPLTRLTEHPVVRSSATEQEQAKGLHSKERRSGRGSRSGDDIRQVADLRRTDHVLDIGCAEGLTTLEVAKVVERTHGFDRHPARVAEATRLAADRGLPNATFEPASVADYPFEPLSYDVTLLMSVWDKPADDRGTTRTVGADELRRILGATRRQLVMRVDVQQIGLEGRVEEILDACEQSDFDALCFSRAARKRGTGETPGNLLIANRRGTDARVGELPRLALIPISRLTDHPVVTKDGRRSTGSTLWAA